MGSEEVYEVNVDLYDHYANLRFFTYQASLPDCLIFGAGSKYCSGKPGATFQPDIRLCLIDQAHARSKSGGSLIDQAAA